MTATLLKHVAVKSDSNAAHPVPTQSVFGGVDIMSRTFFMEVVSQCDAATLTPIVAKYIAPGSRIWSVERPAYRHLNQMGYQHETFDGRGRFVDPVTGVHVNHIRARWSALKAAMTEREYVPDSHLASYIDEYVWRHWRARHSNAKHLSAFADIIAAIRVHYPV